jgi:hypothetical protein
MNGVARMRERFLAYRARRAAENLLCVWCRDRLRRDGSEYCSDECSELGMQFEHY